MTTSTHNHTPHTKSTYSQGHAPGVIRSHTARTVSNSAAFLLPHLKPTNHILDIGCGPGTITNGFVQFVPEGSVLGLDSSTEVVEQARSLAASSSRDGTAPANLSFETGDVLSGLKYPDHSFDVIYMHQTLIHLPDPVRALHEAHRLLKPGGVLAARESDSFLWHHTLPGLERQGEALSRMLQHAGANGLPTGRLVHGWAAEAGFERAKMIVGAGTTMYASPEERKWFADLHVERTKQTVIGEKYRESGTTTAEIEEIITDLRRWEQDVNGWHCTVQSEVLCWK